MSEISGLYRKLFTATFYLSTFTFGGGYVIVPLMEKQFVNELGWIDRDEMLDLVAIGQSAPGPIAVNTSILIGYRMAGVRGALVTSLGTVLPPLIIMTIVTYFYLALRDNVFVQNILLGMQAGVAAIIVNVVYNMAIQIIQRKRIIPILVMFISLAGGLIFDVNIIYILLFAAIIGALTTLYDIYYKPKGGKL